MRIKAEAEAKVRMEAEQRAKAEKAKQRSEQMEGAKAAVAATGRTATHIIGLIIRWLLGLSYILIALMFIGDAIVMSVSWILAGLLILPPVTKLVPAFKGRKIVIVLVCIVLLVIGAMSFPTV